MNILDAREAAHKVLTGIPGVLATAIGPRIRQGQTVPGSVLAVLVEKKIEENRLEESHKIPKVMFGYEVDVVEFPRPRATTTLSDSFNSGIKAKEGPPELLELVVHQR